MRLTQSQVERFDADGFLVLPNLFTPDEIAVLRAALPALYAEETPANIREKRSGEVRTAMGLHARHPVYGRLVRLITTLAVERDGVMMVPEKLTQQDIAERVGASRDMISRLLKDLVTGGYLSIADKKITILKKPPTAW